MAQKKRTRATRRSRAPDGARPVLEVAFAGLGVRPATMPARDLAEMLIAATQLVEAFQPGASLALIALKNGSAAYHMRPSFRGSDNMFRGTIETLFDVAAKRGENTTPEARRALLRLVKCGASYGGIRITSRSVPGGERMAMLAAPDERTATGMPMTSVIHGEVAGVEKNRNGYLVTIKPESGPRVDLEADRSIATHAARFFAREEPVAATVRLLWDPLSGREEIGEVIDIVRWSSNDPAQVLAGVRTQIESAGGFIDGAELEAAVFGEEA